MRRQLPTLLLVSAILVVLLLRLHVFWVRFFDPDEFAHLHWAWLVTQGKLPYQDFFSYATPLFQWFLLPLFRLPPSDTVLLLARLSEFVLYLLTLFLLFRISQRVTRYPLPVTLLSLLIFLTFPLTFDKTIDIRPDILMTVLYFFAIERIISGKKPFIIGLLLGTSFLVLFKIIYALPAALLLFYTRFHLAMQGGTLRKLAIGFFLPIGIFCLYLVMNNLTGLAWIAFSHTQFVVNAGKETFSLLATLSPWPLVYVSKGGVSIPWLVNMGIWLAALLGLTIMWKQNKPFAIFSGCFAFSALVFLALFPVPYVQYFIPLSAVASILAAVALGRFSIFISMVLLVSFFLQYRERVVPTANNAEQLQVVRDVLKISQPTDTFYDMVGSYVFRPDGFFICCHPYAEFVDQLKTQPPTLRESLIHNQTKFVVLDRTGLLFWKPKKEDLDFLLANYVPSKYPKIYIRN